MPENVPAQVLRRRLMDRVGDVGEGAGDVVLESVLADVAEQRLKARDLDDTGAAERLEVIPGEFTLADVAGDPPGAVVRRESRESHGPRLHLSDDRSIGVLSPDRPGDDRLIVHRGIVEEIARQVAAVKADRL